MLANLVYYPLPCLLHVEAVSKSLVSSSECIAHRLFSPLPCDAVQFYFAFFMPRCTVTELHFETSLLLFLVVLVFWCGFFISGTQAGDMYCMKKVVW